MKLRKMKYAMFATPKDMTNLIDSYTSKEERYIAAQVAFQTTNCVLEYIATTLEEMADKEDILAKESCTSPTAHILKAKLYRDLV